MCIIIDADTFASVFDRNSQKHGEFRPVLEWILYGKGKIVYGGTEYREELRRAARYRRLFVELSRVQKVVQVDFQKVDRKQRELENLVHHRDFDDQHLVAIVIVSECKLICSGDARAYPFFKQKGLYPKHMGCPKIYRGKRNKDLLCDRNIADICKPCAKLRKAVSENLLA